LNPSQLWDQVFTNIALDDVSADACRYCGPLKSAGVVLADDENPNRGEFCFENLGYFQAIHAWHGDVQQYDVRLMLPDFAEGIIPICRLANDFDIRLRTENLADAAPDALVIVYNGHTKYASSDRIPG
jgi:hypothetical protein